MSLKKWSYLAAAASLIAAALACNTPGSATEPMPTLNLPTTVPIGILSPTPSSATAGPAGLPTPTPKPAPTSKPPTTGGTTGGSSGGGSAPSAPSGKRVSFAAGATQAEISGSLAANGADNYVLGVAGGQLIEVGSEQPSDMKVTITAPSGAALASGGSLVRAVAPANGDYVVTIKAGASAMSYTALIVIPEPVSFAQNATESTISGQIGANTVHHYSLALQAGQLADIVFPNNSGVHTVFYGADGTYLQGQTNQGTGYRGPIPTTQTYVLAVIGGSQTVSFTARIIVPQRLSFASGATLIDAAGTLAANGVFEYVINLRAGQAMEIQSNTPASGFGVSVTGPGDALVPGSSTSAPFFRGKVPADGDYVIILAGGASTISYDLSISVPVRISFASGATSATQTGSLQPHATIQFVVGANGGQTMDVLFTPENTAKMTIYGNDGNVLWSGMGEGTHWNGALPSSQDYFIHFTAGDNAVSFTLKVTIN